LVSERRPDSPHLKIVEASMTQHAVVTKFSHIKPLPPEDGTGWLWK
jgi:hypothetical protein